MTEPHTSHRKTRERPERDARFLAWDVPGDAHIVALVHESSEAERSATVVDAIATSVARRREHTLLLSADPGPSPLDELLGGVDSEGLPAALSGRARLTDVAVQRVDRPFVYLPAGRDAEAMRSLLEKDVLTSFVGRVRERGGTLFLVISEQTRLSPGILELLDGYVTLGDAKLPPGAEGLEPLSHVRFDDGDVSTPEPPPPGGPSAGPFVFAEPDEDVPEAAEETDGTDADVTQPAVDGAESEQAEPRTSVGSRARGRTPGRFSKGLVGVGLGVAAALFFTWWWLARGAGGGPPAVAGPVTVERAEAASPAESPVEMDSGEASLVLESAPELPFSVLIASYADRSDADDRVERLRSGTGGRAGLFFVSPTPVRGVVYHRVFAGALPTETAAASLMDRLVASGEKDESSAWHLRPVRLAFDLGIFADRAGAEARIAALDLRGVPSYVLTASLGPRSVYQVYTGGYEAERASLPMAEILGEAGEAAMLIARRGGADATSTP